MHSNRQISFENNLIRQSLGKGSDNKSHVKTATSALPNFIILITVQSKQKKKHRTKMG